MLASGSPRRAALLARLGLTPVLRPTAVDETPRPDESAAELVVRLAGAKAAASVAVAASDGMGSGEVGDGTASDEVVLAADTVVTLDGVVLGKPRDRDDAASTLRRLAGRTHEVVTGVAAIRGPISAVIRVTTAVTFRDLTDAEVAWYLATGEPDDKAGAYGLQGAGAALVRRVEGSDTNVVGLPLAETVDLLRDVGFDPLDTHST